MNSRWNDGAAAAAVERYGPGHGEDVALRLYSARLLGAERKLVLHGGGNTSVKTTQPDPATGEPLDVLCVKGSGHDLATLEPEGLPALEYAPLRRLRQLESLSDRAMTGELRRRMLDPRGPDPSIETLLHAFLPHRFVDHTHADAILELTDQPDARELLRDALGEGVVVLPWIMPGHPLARAVADAYERQPDCEGIVLEKHGLFTFGDGARASYQRMIELVDRAERFVDARAGRTLAAVPADGAAASLATDVLPVVRGALAVAAAGAGAGTRPRRVIASWRGDGDLVAFSRRAGAAELVRRGPLTPDHVIRTKGSYLWLSRQDAADPEACRAAVEAYAADYRRYYEAHRHEITDAPELDDPQPKVAVVEGCGVLAFGADKRAAEIAGDIAEQTLRSIERAEAIGRYAPLDSRRLFEIEHWSLEQRKLGAAAPLPLAGQVGVVSGAAGAIGCGIADEMLAAGCHVMLTDIDARRLAVVVERLAARHPAERIAHHAGDITDAEAVAGLFQAIVRRFGGIDVVVPNAGIAYVAKLRDMDAGKLRQVIEVNLVGTMLMLQQAARVYERQRTGGAVVVQSSKNVFDPGAGFGAYSASKAGAHQLGKIAALELAPLGVRVNMINADAVFGDDEVPSGLWAEVGPDRMKSRGLDAEGLREFYRNRSLLKQRVLPSHVGRGVVFFAAGETPTTGATLPVDAGIPGAFPR